MFLQSMKKRYTVHFVWALIAAGTGWLGAWRNAGSDASQGETRSRLAAAVDIPQSEAASAKRRAASIAGGTEEASSWLQKWSAANGSISAENMADAMTEAMRDPDSVRGLRHFTHLLECLNSDNAPAALAALKAHSGPRESSLWMNLFCTAWGAKEGASALAAVTTRDEREAALTGWARSNSAAAMEWLAALPKEMDSGDRRGLERSLVRGMARNDPQAALDYIATASDRSDLVRVLTREQVANGVPATARWAAELPDSDLRGPALEAVARHYMQVDPASGMVWAAESATAPEMRQAVGRIADRMADQDVLAAYKWTQQLPPGAGQEEAYQQVFSEWARKDPTASSQELLRMPTGPQRDNAIHSFAGSLVRENPQDAMVWATAIGDPGLRLNTQIDVARKWHDTSPAAAQSWIAANLPADAQNRALGK
jgi:hypothetical protein